LSRRLEAAMETVTVVLNVHTEDAEAFCGHTVIEIGG
jgi:hypothetical protein